MKSVKHDLTGKTLVDIESHEAVIFVDEVFEGEDGLYFNIQDNSGSYHLLNEEEIQSYETFSPVLS